MGTLKLRAYNHLSTEEVLGLRGTKATGVYFCKANKDMYEEIKSMSGRIADNIQHMQESPRQLDGIDVTTWSSAIRNILDIVRPIIANQISKFGTADFFREGYEQNLRAILEEQNIGANSNFVRRLYKEAEEDDLIRSTVYKNNKNHMLEILSDENGFMWFACAVYTGEIVWMTEALLDTIADTFVDMYGEEEADKIFQPYIEINYEHRESIEDRDEIADTVEEIDEEMNKLEMAKELIKIQQDVMVVSNSIMSLYGKINDFMEKYDIPTMDDLLKD